LLASAYWIVAPPFDPKGVALQRFEVKLREKVTQKTVVCDGEQ
jgi:hypothetical protein